MAVQDQGAHCRLALLWMGVSPPRNDQSHAGDRDRLTLMFQRKRVIVLDSKWGHHRKETDAEAEAPILWPPDVKSQLIGKAPDAGKD